MEKTTENEKLVLPRELDLKRVTTFDFPQPPQSIFYEYKSETNPKARFLNSYDSYFYKFLRHKFPGSENIQRNFSAAMHDMFILSCLDGKRDGTYVEIGGGLPCCGNNTFLLESQFGWKGISFDIDKQKVNLYNKVRRNKCLLQDACSINLNEVFEENNLGPHIDYLQIDIEPVQQSLAALKNISFDKYSFSIIQFEHEYCNHQNDYFPNIVHELLTSHGYKLAVKNVHDASEDWYYNPNTVNPDVISKMIREESFGEYELGYDDLKQVYLDTFLWGHETILDLPHDLSPYMESTFNFSSYDTRNCFSVPLPLR